MSNQAQQLSRLRIPQKWHFDLAIYRLPELGFARVIQFAFFKLHRAPEQGEGLKSIPHSGFICRQNLW